MARVQQSLMLATPKASSETYDAAWAADRLEHLGARAWALALWIVDDEHLAERTVIAAFRDAQDAVECGCHYDASLLFDVRRRAIAAVEHDTVHVAGHETRGLATRATFEGNRNGVRRAVTSLPERQRAVLEFVLLGRLSATAIASRMKLSRAEVASHLAEAMRTLRPLLERADATGELALAHASVLPSLPADAKVNGANVPARLDPLTPSLSYQAPSELESN